MKMKKIYVDSSIRDLIIEKYINYNGIQERCGLILGKEKEKEILIETLADTRNCRRYFGFGITLKEFERVMKISKKTLIGIFHTHRKESKPSYSDINQMMGAPYPISMIITDSLPAPYFEIYYHPNKSMHNLTKEVLWNSS